MNVNMEVARYNKFINPHWSAVLKKVGHTPLFIKAKAEFLYDSENRPWLDFIGHYGVSILGHNDDRVIREFKAILESDIPVGTPMGLAPAASTLAIRLIEKLKLVGAWRMCTLTTGTEAVEGALKCAILYSGKKKILVRTGAFHGNSALTMQLSSFASSEVDYDGFLLTPEVCFFDEYSEAIEFIATGEIAAVIIEPVQAMAGGRFCNGADANDLIRACRQWGTLCIVDEVFSGIGRCGDFSAMQALKWGEQPDLIILSKTLTAGIIPSAQLLMRADIFDCYFSRPGCYKSLGSTFAGNNFALKLSLVMLELLDDYLDKKIAFEPLTQLSQSIIRLQSEWPQLIAKVVILGACIFIHFFSANVCFTIWRALFMRSICTTVCPHASSSLKMVFPLTVRQDSLDRFLSVFSLVVSKIDPNA